LKKLREGLLKVHLDLDEDDDDDGDDDDDDDGDHEGKGEGEGEGEEGGSRCLSASPPPLWQSLKSPSPAESR
jgi:hypothetical protein